MNFNCIFKALLYLFTGQDGEKIKGFYVGYRKTSGHTASTPGARFACGCPEHCLAFSYILACFPESPVNGYRKTTNRREASPV